MKFKTVQDASAPGPRTKLWPRLQELKKLSVKAWNPEYVAESEEEAEAIAVIRENPEEAWGVLETTKDAATAYSRAASLRRATLPKGTWSFKGQKVTGEDGTEAGEVLGRYESEEDPVEDDALAVFKEGEQTE